jgi:hypothetical protein
MTKMAGSTPFSSSFSSPLLLFSTAHCSDESGNTSLVSDNFQLRISFPIVQSSTSKAFDHSCLYQKGYRSIDIESKEKTAEPRIITVTRNRSAITRL